MYAVPALANAGPDSDPCSGPLKVTMESKKRPNVSRYYGKSGRKIQMFTNKHTHKEGRPHSLFLIY
jgi:hypothetical protein